MPLSNQCLEITLIRLHRHHDDALLFSTLQTFVLFIDNLQLQGFSGETGHLRVLQLLQEVDQLITVLHE